MKPVIGLFEEQHDLTLAINELKNSGLTEEQIAIFSRQSEVQNCLHCKPKQIMTHYISLGASIGVGVYAIFALFAGLCQCKLLQFSEVYGLGTIIGGILAGLFIGGAIGLLIGIAEGEIGTHLYLQGIRMGGKVVLVKAPEQDIYIVQRILKKDNALGIKIL